MFIERFLNLYSVPTSISTMLLCELTLSNIVKTAKFSVTRNGDKKALDLAIKAKRKADRNS